MDNCTRAGKDSEYDFSRRSDASIVPTLMGLAGVGMSRSGADDTPVLTRNRTSSRGDTLTHARRIYGAMIADC